MHLLSAWEGGGVGWGGWVVVWTSYQILTKEGGLNRISILRGGCCERGGRLLSGEWGCSFYVKNKQKSEVFNGKKKVYKQKFFSLS